jgi:GTP-binding protein
MPTISIVGRPNVGKSTLFNRLAGKRLALVDDTPGLTRDFREAEGSLGPYDFRLLDTPGLEEDTGHSLEAGMRRQTELALEQSQLALFVIDARVGLTQMDRHFAEWLRRRDCPVILIANKSEGKQGDAGYYEAFELGLGEPISISAEHGLGLIDLQEAIAPYFADMAADDAPQEDDGERRIHMAIVGRPNAGKSTLVNALLGESRVLTGDMPGTTRDAIAVDWVYEGQAYRLIDTAGLRRQARINEPIERMATSDTLRQIRLAQIVVLLMEADGVLDKQDLTIAKLVLEEGRALVIAVNKWDVVTDRKESLQRLSDRLESSLAQAKGIATVTLSALKGEGLSQLMHAVADTYRIWDTRVSTAQLNRFLEGMVEGNPPPLASGRSNKLRYMTQVKARPPTFALWGSRPDELPETYIRYLVSGLRRAFDMPGVPIRILLKKTKNPFTD